MASEAIFHFDFIEQLYRDGLFAENRVQLVNLYDGDYYKVLVPSGIEFTYPNTSKQQELVYNDLGRVAQVLWKYEEGGEEKHKLIKESGKSIFRDTGVEVVCFNQTEGLIFTFQCIGL